MPSIIAFSPMKVGRAFVGLVAENFQSVAKTYEDIVRAIRFADGTFILFGTNGLSSSNRFVAHSSNLLGGYGWVGANASVLWADYAISSCVAGTILAHNSQWSNKNRVWISRDYGVSWATSAAVYPTSAHFLGVEIGYDADGNQYWVAGAETITDSASTGTPSTQAVRSINGGASWINIRGSSGTFDRIGFNPVRRAFFHIGNRQSLDLGVTWVTQSNTGFTANGGGTGRPAVSLNGKSILIGTITGVGVGISWTEDHINWNHVPIVGGPTAWSDMTYGEGMYVLTNAGTNWYAYSYDLINWTLGNFPNGFQCGRTCFGNRQFVFMPSAQQSNYLVYPV